MGKPDAFAKLIFAKETNLLTDGACQWQGPREINIGDHVLTDGHLLTQDMEHLKTLRAPWCLVEDGETVIEIKMGGDHLGPRAWYRGLLRRAARDVERAEASEGDGWAGYSPLWFVASNVPGWIQDEHVLIPKEKGCYAVKGWPFTVLWIAANDLPLHESLIPFLTARRNKPRVAFARWVSRRRGVSWVSRMLRAYNMKEAEIKEHVKFFTPENQEDEEWNTMFARVLLNELTPNVRNELIAQGELKPLLHLFERRLSRTLTPSERAALLTRVESLGPERVGDVVLDLSPEALAAWLADPQAQ